MKIDNYQDVRLTPKSAARGNTVPEAVHQAGNSPAVSEVRTSPKMRELGNALLVMQKAQMIVQQALSVSSRLQNIAAEGMNQGAIDYSQINTELAQVSSTFENLSPSMREQVTPISENLQKARQAFDSGDLKTYDAALTEAGQELNDQNDRIVRDMGAHTLSAIEAQRTAAVPLADEALTVQGNVSAERATRLLSF